MTIEYRDLTPERAEDLLAFFEGPAFADNPQWATCYCYAYHFTGPDAEWERTGAANRKAKACPSCRRFLSAGRRSRMSA